MLYPPHDADLPQVCDALLAGRNFGCGGFDRIGQPGLEPVISIDPDRCLLDAGKRMNDAHRHPLFRDEWEIHQTALRLRAPVHISRHLDLAETIGFDPDILRHGALLMAHRSLAQSMEVGSMMSGAVYAPPSIGLPFVAVIFSANEIIATKATLTAEEGHQWVNLIILGDEDDDA